MADLEDDGGCRLGGLDPVEEVLPPTVALATAMDREPGALNRDVFSAPRDTRPLPQLAFEGPPSIVLRENTPDHSIWRPARFCVSVCCNSMTPNMRF